MTVFFLLYLTFHLFPKYVSHFVSSKKQLNHITNHNKYTAKQDIIKKITYCCHEQNVQITIGNSDGGDNPSKSEPNSALISSIVAVFEPSL